MLTGKIYRMRSMITGGFMRGFLKDYCYYQEQTRGMIGHIDALGSFIARPGENGLADPEQIAGRFEGDLFISSDGEAFELVEVM